MNYSILSTIPHFFSIFPIIKYYNTFIFGYINVIFLSTTFSILYHLFNESNFIINTIDYLFALIWFSYDIYLGYIYTNIYILFKIIFVNCLSFIINIIIPYNNYYILNHSIWHIMNAYKCFYISTLIKPFLKINQ